MISTIVTNGGKTKGSQVFQTVLDHLSFSIAAVDATVTFVRSKA